MDPTPYGTKGNHHLAALSLTLQFALTLPPLNLRLIPYELNLFFRSQINIPPHNNIQPLDNLSSMHANYPTIPS